MCSGNGTLHLKARLCCGLMEGQNRKTEEQEGFRPYQSYGGGHHVDHSLECSCTSTSARCFRRTRRVPAFNGGGQRTTQWGERIGKNSGDMLIRYLKQAFAVMLMLNLWCRRRRLRGWKSRVCMKSHSQLNTKNKELVLELESVASARSDCTCYCCFDLVKLQKGLRSCFGSECNMYRHIMQSLYKSFFFNQLPVHEKLASWRCCGFFCWYGGG